MIVIDVVVKHINGSIVRPCINSARSRLGGFDVRADQNGQKVDFEYPPPKFGGANLGTPKTQKTFNPRNFPNSLLHPKFNFHCIRLFGKFKGLDIY